jgi:tRNA-uridine 2-sulfurtransferase
LNDRPQVVVAMSGGVDSSVAAALLVEQGFAVTGMMLRLWSEPGKDGTNRCCTPDAMALARRVAQRLGIPFYAIDAQDYFRSTIVDFFLKGYQQGVTPNPCLACNRQVRFGFLLERARSIGAVFLATGHYARLQRSCSGPIQLQRAVDQAKDQSYVLHVLNQTQLEQSLFPMGEYTKPEVRQMARDFKLPVAERSDSQDLCFLAGEDYRPFISRHAPEAASPGPILDTSGRQIGQHQGLAFYTIGQRKGLGISSPQPLYVLEKDLHTNTLVIGPAEDLGRQELLAEQVSWISGQTPPDPFRAEVMIRYKARPATALVTPLSDQRVRVQFDEKLRDITPGQAAVFYQNETCLGGGIISG